MGGELARGVVLSGGCQCGHIRYEVRAAPGRAFYCHCRMCQRLSGAPVMAMVRVPIEAFAYVGGEPCVFVSSEKGERRFCPRCGSQLEFRYQAAPTTVEICVGTLDDPSVAQPAVHIFTESRVPWFETTDTHPRRKRLTE